MNKLFLIPLTLILFSGIVNARELNFSETKEVLTNLTPILNKIFQGKCCYPLNCPEAKNNPKICDCVYMIMCDINISEFPHYNITFHADNFTIFTIPDSKYGCIYNGISDTGLNMWDCRNLPPRKEIINC